MRKRLAIAAGVVAVALGVVLFLGRGHPLPASVWCLDVRLKGASVVPGPYLEFDACAEPGRDPIPHVVATEAFRFGFEPENGRAVLISYSRSELTRLVERVLGTKTARADEVSLRYDPTGETRDFGGRTWMRYVRASK